ncbi:hypothetical protein NliqN6_4797 [Naganishia liquefaciens]|uniref:Uncharacterized protein n=1 Tax=Naganishia liquefaciens TaxID=104408 RepID=A0A8H3TX26_9TREE|nr:hypothetical protein NliqN6_4797 [Naganishia liquefaciens]
MGAAQSILTPSDRDTVLQAPPGYVTPKWPGLYTPTWGVRRSNGNGTDVLPGNFLFEAIDVWEYTLYWHLVFHALIFGLPALWFTMVSLFSPTSSLSLRVRSKKKDSDLQWMEMQPIRDLTEQRVERPGSASSRLDKRASRNGVVGITSTGETIQISSVQTNITADPSVSADGELLVHGEAPLRNPKPPSAHRNRARPRKSAPMYLAFLPFIFLALWGMASALIMSTIIGFVLAAVYNTTGFEMTTWVPFLWGCIEASIVVITSWSTFTTIL